MSFRFLIDRSRALFLFAFLSLAALSVAAQTSYDERREIFEQVWTLIDEKYYDASFNGVDWRAVKMKYAARIDAASNDRDFYALLDRMAGELRDSHTRVYSPAQRDERRNQKRAEIGVGLKEIGGAVVIFSVAPGSEAARAGIRPGMIVRAVNGRPIKKAVADAQRAVGVSSSERATRMRVLSKILSGAPETVLKLELTDANGVKLKFALTRRPMSSKPSVAARRLPSGIAYLKFGVFSEEFEKEIENALRDFRDAPALVIDLRGNGGGDGDVGLRFAGHFFDDRITIAKIVTRDGKPPLPEIPLTLETGAKNGRIFSRPVAILVNEGTASTAELVTNAFQERRRAVVFGTNSCGCVLAFLDYKPLKGGGDLSFSEFGFVTANGKRLEGAGVVPDRIVPLRLEDVRAGRDRALDEAELFLRKSIE